MSVFNNLAVYPPRPTTPQTEHPSRMALSPDELAFVWLVVEKNIASGRVRRFCGEHHEAKLPGYIDRVITTFSQEQERVLRLAAADETEWQDLKHSLTQAAGRLLHHLGLETATIEQLAAEYAHDTCEILFRSRYPFDVPFFAWARRILTNRIYRDFTRSRDVWYRERHMSSLDELAYTEADVVMAHETVADTGAVIAMERVELQDWMMWGINRLVSPDQRAVLIATYFLDMSDRDIARRLGKTKNAVHVLRHRGLASLSKHLNLELSQRGQHGLS